MPLRRSKTRTPTNTFLDFYPDRTVMTYSDMGKDSNGNKSFKQLSNYEPNTPGFPIVEFNPEVEYYSLPKVLQPVFAIDVDKQTWAEVFSILFDSYKDLLPNEVIENKNRPGFHAIYYLDGTWDITKTLQKENGIAARNQLMLALHQLGVNVDLSFGLKNLIKNPLNDNYNHKVIHLTEHSFDKIRDICADFPFDKTLFESIKTSQSDTRSNSYWHGVFDASPTIIINDILKAGSKLAKKGLSEKEVRNELANQFTIEYIIDTLTDAFNAEERVELAVVKSHSNYIFDTYVKEWSLKISEDYTFSKQYAASCRLFYDYALEQDNRSSEKLIVNSHNIATRLGEKTKDVYEELGICKSTYESYKRKLKSFGATFFRSIKQFKQLDDVTRTDITKKNIIAHAEYVGHFFLEHAPFQMNGARIKWLRLVAWVKDSIGLMTKDTRNKIENVLGKVDHDKKQSNIKRMVSKLKYFKEKNIKQNSKWNSDFLNNISYFIDINIKEASASVCKKLDQLILDTFNPEFDVLPKLF